MGQLGYTVTLVLKEDLGNENHDEPHNTAASQWSNEM